MQRKHFKLSFAYLPQSLSLPFFSIYILDPLIRLSSNTYFFSFTTYIQCGFTSFAAAWAVKGNSKHIFHQLPLQDYPTLQGNCASCPHMPLPLCTFIIFCIFQTKSELMSFLWAALRCGTWINFQHEARDKKRPQRCEEEEEAEEDEVKAGAEPPPDVA